MDLKTSLLIGQQGGMMRGPQSTFFKTYVIGDIKGWHQSLEAERSKPSNQLSASELWR